MWPAATDCDHLSQQHASLTMHKGKLHDTDDEADYWQKGQLQYL